MRMQNIYLLDVGLGPWGDSGLGGELIDLKKRRTGGNRTGGKYVGQMMGLTS